MRNNNHYNENDISHDGIAIGSEKKTIYKKKTLTEEMWGGRSLTEHCDNNSARKLRKWETVTYF